MFTLNVVSAASAIRDAASSTQTLKKLTAVKAKTKTDSGKRSSTSVRDNEDEETVSKPLDRNRESLLYVDDDLNTSIPKLEKIIDRDKERIRQQQEDAKPKKKPAVNQSSSSNNNSGRAEKKMEASAQKFKTFLSNDIESTPTRDDKKLNGDLNNSLPMAGTSKASTPAKIETKPQTPVQSAKRPSSAHWSMEESSAKKKRPSASETEPLHYKPFGKLLEGVVIVISGIQVINCAQNDFPFSRDSCACFMFRGRRIPTELTSETKHRKWALDINQIGMVAALI